MGGVFKAFCTGLIGAGPPYSDLGGLNFVFKRLFFFSLSHQVSKSALPSYIVGEYNLLL